MDEIGPGSFPCSQRRSSSLGGMANLLPQPEDYAESSELVSEVMHMTDSPKVQSVIIGVLKVVLDFTAHVVP